MTELVEAVARAVEPYLLVMRAFPSQEEAERWATDVCPRAARTIAQAAIAAARPAIVEWQPMETAPRDGTRMLLSFDGETIEGWLDLKLRSDGTSYGNPEWAVVSMNSHGCGCCWSENPEPDAWMPLPEAPTAIRAMRGEG